MVIQTMSALLTRVVEEVLAELLLAHQAESVALVALVFIQH
jgi:hypothetical protein